MRQTLSRFWWVAKMVGAPADPDQNRMSAALEKAFSWSAFAATAERLLTTQSGPCQVRSWDGNSRLSFFPPPRAQRRVRAAVQVAELVGLGFAMPNQDHAGHEALS